MYEKQEQVEKLFDAYKFALSADKLYLQDNEAIFGHVFVSFHSLYAYSKLEMALKRRSSIAKFLPQIPCSNLRMFITSIERTEVITEVPKKLSDIEAELRLDQFPIVAQI